MCVLMPSVNRQLCLRRSVRRFKVGGPWTGHSGALDWIVVLLNRKDRISQNALEIHSAWDTPLRLNAMTAARSSWRVLVAGSTLHLSIANNVATKTVLTAHSAKRLCRAPVHVVESSLRLQDHAVPTVGVLPGQNSSTRTIQVSIGISRQATTALLPSPAGSPKTIPGWTGHRWHQ